MTVAKVVDAGLGVVDTELGVVDAELGVVDVELGEDDGCAEVLGDGSEGVPADSSSSPKMSVWASAR